MYSWILGFSATEVALLLFMEYADLGKWVAATEGVYLSRLGLPLLLFFNCTAVLCQYLGNCICLVTGKNLAQICSEQYSRLTCLLLGTAVWLSMIASGLTKILGVAHGFSVLFEMGFLSSTFLASIVSVVLPIIFSFLGSHKLKELHLGISFFTPLFYVLGVHHSQLEASSVTHNAYSGVNLKSVSTLMALLGAQIMPHNFYIHPCIIQQQRRHLNISRSVVIQTHLFAIVSIFTTIFLVNSVIMNSALSEFNSYGSLMPSFQDGLLLMDQTFRSPAATLPFCLCFLLSSLLGAITHGQIGKVIARDFFLVNLPSWVYHIIAKAFAIIPALYCTQRAGSEEIYQLLFFCQVISAILLPPSVIPLFQLSSSQLIMGAFRISRLVEFLCMVAFTVIFAANSLFIIELLFGNGGWSGDLTGEMGNNLILYFLLCLLALASLFFTLYLFFTQFKLSVNEPHMKTYTRELQTEQTKQSESREENGSIEVLDNTYQNSVDKIMQNSILDCQCECSFIESSLGDSETNINCEHGSQKADLVSNPTTTYSSSKMESVTDEVFSGVRDILNLLEDEKFLESNEENVILKRGVTPEGNERSSSFKALEFSYSSGSKVQGSKKYIMTDKATSVVNGKEATSGFSRRGKQQLASILDEFWGLLFDYHGKLTEEAKRIRAAILLGLDCEPSTTCTLFEPVRKTYPKTQVAKTDPVLPTLSSLSPLVATPNFLEPLKPDSVTEAVPSALVDDFKSKHHEDDISKPIQLTFGCETIWTKSYFIPFVNFIGQDKSIYSPYETLTWGGKIIYSTSGAPKKFLTYGESERLVLQSLRFCIMKLLRLDKSGWLFSQNGGPDEELIDCLAMREGLLHTDGPCEVHENLIPNMSYCSKGCIWQASLVVSFGVWCVRRILELLLVESRPDLWGKYTYVLNRLQGILDPAFCKPRKRLSPCKCLQQCHYSREISATAQVTSKSSVLELIRGAEASTMRRRGQVGTGAGDIAFPKGKENVASVFKRYKHRLANRSP